MTKNNDTLPTLGQNKWLRFAGAILLALAVSCLILFMPIKAGTSLQLSLSSLSQNGSLMLSIPLGAGVVQAAGGLTITKIAPATVNQGETMTYTVRVNNNTGQVLTSGTIADSAPLNTTCSTAQPSNSPFWSGNCSPDGSGVGWGLIYSPPIFPTPFADNSTSVVTFSVVVAQPLPDRSVIVNDNYSITAANGATSFSDSGVPITTVVNAPTWEISKSASAAVVEPGDFLTYTLTITNSGQLTTTGNYTITDIVPNNTDFISASTPFSLVGDTITWVDNQELAPLGGSQTLTFTVQVTSPWMAATSEIVNQTYRITGGNVFSPALGLPVTVTVDVPVTLTLTKSADPEPVPAGDILTYTLTVTNATSSKGLAGNIVLTDTVPANTLLVEAGFMTPTAGMTATSGLTPGSVLTWTVTSPDPLPIGEAVTVFMSVRVTTPLTNNTVITNETYGADAANDQVTLVGQVPVTTTVESAPVLEIFKEGLPAEVQAGGLLTYTILYTNSGNANATNVVISDVFPSATSFADEDSNPVVHPGSDIVGGRRWNVGTVAGLDDNGVITLTLAVSSPQDPDTILTNVVALASSEVATPTLFTATNTITSTPELRLRKTADPSPVAVGSILTYTISYSNTGNADATGVVITDQLDSNVTFVDASNGGIHSNGVVTWTGLNVPAGGLDQSVTFSVTVASNLPNDSTLTNQVQIAAGNVVTTTAITTLVQAPSLTVTKTVSPAGVVRAGDNLQYRIAYTNTGSITITLPGILITDTIPVSLTNIVSESLDAAFQSAAPPAYVWGDDLVPPGEGGVITVTGQVITTPWAASGGQIVNEVIVAGSSYSATATVANEGRPGLPFTLTVFALPSTSSVDANVVVGAQALDFYGNPIFDGTAITLTTSLSGTTINGTGAPVVVATTGGIATANLTSTVVGTSTITAQVLGQSGTLSNTTVVTFIPGAVTSFRLQATSPQTAGINFPLTISALDQYGNFVNTFDGTVTLTDTTGTISPLTANLNNGIVVRTISITRATSPALDIITAISGTITGTVGVEILPNVPTRPQVAVAPTVIQICGTATVTTTLTDQFGNPIPNLAVDLTILPAPGPDGNGTFTPPSGPTNAAGLFTSILQGTVAGGLRILAESGGLFNPNPLPTVSILTPAIPTTLTLTVAPNPLATGGSAAVVSATVLDCQGPSAGQVVTFTVSNPALAFFATNPVTATTNASGVATATITSGSSDGTVTITGVAGSLVQTTTLDLRSLSLTITKTANPAAGTEVRPGQLLSYIIQVTNDGSVAVSGVVISDTLPAGVNFASCTSSGGSICSGGSTTTVTTPTLGVGESLSANIQVSVTAAVSGTVFSNTAVVRSNQTGLITSNIVAHSVTTATVNTFLPLIYNDFVSAPDLRITDFSIAGSDPNRVVTVVIENSGNASTGEGFWVDFYLNPTTLPNNPSLGGNRRWELTGSQQGIAWEVSALGPDESVTLSSNGAPGTIAPEPDPLTKWNGALPGGSNSLYAFVDSFDVENASFVEILESDENNNMAQQIITAANDIVFEPSSLPDLSNLPPR